MAFYVKATGSALPAWKESLVPLPGPMLDSREYVA
jgi:hypothetical protein